MPAPQELSQQTPAPRAKARMQKSHGGGKFLVQMPGGARGDGYGWNWYLHNDIIKLSKSERSVFRLVSPNIINHQYGGPELP